MFQSTYSDSDYIEQIKNMILEGTFKGAYCPYEDCENFIFGCWKDKCMCCDRNVKLHIDPTYFSAKYYNQSVKSGNYLYYEIK
jgi:hypothetical protein